MTGSTIAQLAADVGPAVIGLRHGSRGGSGVLVAPNLAVTLARNVRQDELTVRIGDRELPARLAGSDPSVDLAVLRIDDGSEHPSAPWGTAGEVTIGTEVFALADPAGHGLRVTAGAVCSDPTAVRGPGGRLIEGAIEHTAPLPRSSGGGPLVDATGRILGLNAIRRDGGLIVAWPAAALTERAQTLASGGITAPARLGVAVSGPRQTRRMRAAVGLEPVTGLLVRGVEPGSPAELSGIARGDVLLSAGDAELNDLDRLYTALDRSAGSELQLRVMRGTDELTLTVTLPT
jgi:S1-C subfamily serine protease